RPPSLTCSGSRLDAGPNPASQGGTIAVNFGYRWNAPPAPRPVVAAAADTMPRRPGSLSELFPTFVGGLGREEGCGLSGTGRGAPGRRRGAARLDAGRRGSPRLLGRLLAHLLGR